MESSVSLSTIERGSALILQTKVEADNAALKSEPITPPDKAVAPTASQPEDKKKTESLFDHLKQSIDELADTPQIGNHNALRFKVDNTTGKITILVLNPEKNLIIRQIPQDISTKLPKDYNELAGMVVDIKV